MRRFRSLLFLLVALAARVPAEDAPVPVGVLELTSENISPAELHLLTDRLRHELVQTNRYAVVEREKMDAILREQGFQQSGCVATECVVEVGQLLGARMMVAGSLGTVGDVYTMTIRLVDVRDGRVLRTAVRDCRCGLPDVLMTVIGQVAADMAEVEAPIQLGSPHVDRSLGIEITGNVYSTTWKKTDSPIHIVGSVTIPEGHELTIYPGVDVVFDTPTEIRVLGKLIIAGSATDSVNLRRGRASGWKGIHIDGGDVAMRYARISNTYDNMDYLVLSRRSRLLVDHSLFCNNGGGIVLKDQSRAEIARSVVARNSKGISSSGSMLSSPYLVLEQCTIIGNGPGIGGPTISANSANLLIKGCIVRNNFPLRSRYFGDARQIGVRDGRLSVEYSNVEQIIQNQRNNITIDPLFADPKSASFVLGFGSPCIDAGDPNSPLDPDGTRADIGAFYFDQRARPVSDR